MHDVDLGTMSSAAELLIFEEETETVVSVPS
jgi:hypothetical protein